MKHRSTRKISLKWVPFLCISFFTLGTIFNNRLWIPQFPPVSNSLLLLKHRREQEIQIVSDDCDTKKKRAADNDVMGEVLKTHKAIESIDKTVAMLQMKVAASRRSQDMQNLDVSTLVRNGSPRKKAFMVIGINTAFSSRRRRDSIRETWMPKGEMLVKLEHQKGIIIRFTIGHSATSSSILDRAIDSEDAQHKAFLDWSTLKDIMDYLQKQKHSFLPRLQNGMLSSTSRWTMMSTLILVGLPSILSETITSQQNVEDKCLTVFISERVMHIFVIGMLAATLGRHRYKPMVYIGCMKSGPVLSKKSFKYHEPEYWKFGEAGNKYFRHASGQIYAISKDLANYIAINEPILHKYANEDVSLGSWFIGLEVEHVNDRNMCVGTPPDCERKAQAGNACVASYDWSCSGICKSVERMKSVHRRCGEGDAVVWSAFF